MNNTQKEFLEDLRRLDKIEIDKTPEYRVVILLKNNLIERGLPHTLVEKIVTSMKIDITEDFLSDKEFYTEAIDIFSNFIYKTYVLTKKDGIERYLSNVASRASLTYKKR